MEHLSLGRPRKGRIEDFSMQTIGSQIQREQSYIRPGRGVARFTVQAPGNGFFPFCDGLQS